MLERQLKEKVLRDLKTLPHCWFIKTQERGRVGTPDILICLRGRFVAIELKQEGKAATPIQRLTLDKIMAANGIAFESSPSQWVEQFNILKGLS